jgi:hypothetical protein
MSKNNSQKGVSLLLIILLIAVSPTIMLSYDNNVGLAQAQDANQTSSAAGTPPSPPFYAIFSNYAEHVSRRGSYWNSGS